MKRKGRIFYLICSCLLGFSSSIQKTYSQSVNYSMHGWQLMDYRTDSIFGAGVNRAYRELLPGKKSHAVVVAVIDAGLDIEHEDLVGHIWTNSGEIPGNNIDDDHNGYIDDIHGWNFLGGKDGRNISVESYESYREYYRLKNSPPGKTKPDSLYLEKVKKYFLRDSLQLAKAVKLLVEVLPQMRASDSAFRSRLHKDSVYIKDVLAFTPEDSSLALLKKNTLMYFKRNGVSTDMSLGRFIKEAENYNEISTGKLKYFSGDPNALRREIVGDSYDDIRDIHYGNNNVSAGLPSHGTHVSGIIAASRDNGKGMDGIDSHVYIMALRAVPEGDERDKDIALAIRYAVDNHAQIINMSFGKYISPGKKWVDEAIKYAELNDVLIVTAAGNESQNLDSVTHFPTPVYESGDRNSCCWITVGASSGGPDSLIMARFSNYGKTEVDLFAPGMRVYSSLPGNQYAAYSGTSMAAPMVSGVAALLLEYYPDLSARQLKFVLMHSVMKPPDNQIKWPGGGWIGFNQLSASGGIVNAYDALLLASTIKGERKNRKR